MRIFIDIGHPAHVHYFKNLMKIMKRDGHEFFITARDKEITFELLNQYSLKYVNRGKGGAGFFGKLIYILKADWLMYKEARKFKPDLFLSFASAYAAHTSKLYGKPHIAIDDTEHAKFELLMYKPFTDVIFTPSCFSKNLGNKQIKLNSYIEFSYLHKDIFEPEADIRKQLELMPDEKFVLLRFVSWKAFHDIGQSGMPNEIKKQLIEILKKNNYKIFISSESKLEEYYEPFRLKTSINLIHSVIKEADMFIGESGTMATEACVLGTPAIYVNSLNAGVFIEEEKYGLLYSFRTHDNLISKINELIAVPKLKEQHLLFSEKLNNEKINITKFLVWFIENYPKSEAIMKTNHEYQNNFN